MTEPWTPGPWSWEPDLVPLKILAGRTDVVCEFASPPLAGDARLMEAAPEMAEFVELFAAETCTDSTDYEESCDDCRLRGRADALLSRIRGEAEVPA